MVAQAGFHLFALLLYCLLGVHAQLYRGRTRVCVGVARSTSNHTAMILFMLLASAAIETGQTPDVWPLPANAEGGSTSISIAPSNIFFKMSGSQSSPILQSAFKRYTAITFPHSISVSRSASSGGKVSSLIVSVLDLDESHPTITTDESYSLRIEQSSALLKANTVYGVLRGLETFSQLVMFDFEKEGYTIDNGPWRITDAPRFPHRG